MTEYSRIILKRSFTPGVTPTVPELDNLNQFIGTDIFEGELFLNIPDNKLYTRANNEIILLNDFVQSETYTKVYPIGPWNMSNPIVVNVPEFNADEVVNISLSIRNDDGDEYFTNNKFLNVELFDGSNIYLLAEGDLTNNTLTTFSRGWIRIEFRKI
jgi:hypothetical protein